MSAEEPVEPVDLALALALMAVAGCVDAVGFLKLGHLFVSFMSGDTTQFAIYIAQTRWTQAARAGMLVGLFVAGVIAGRMIWHRAARPGRPVILMTVMALLGLALLLSLHRLAMYVPLVLAMGLQNEAIHQAGHVRTNLTYVTGTLVRLGEHLADALLAPRFSWGWLPYLLQWAALLAGAVLGAWSYARLSDAALMFPIAVLGATSLVTWRQAVKAPAT